MKLDKHSNVPLYAQLKDLLIERIENGQYESGSKIPSELVLCRELDLSRPTVRQAVAELVSEGILVIVKGRGTFVADQAEQFELQRFSAFSCSFLMMKELESITFDQISRREPDEEIEKLFGNAVQQHGCWQIDWSIRTDSEIVGWCSSLIPVMMFPELADDLRIGKKMIDIVANKYAYLPQKGNLRMQVRSAGDDEARYLDISKRSPVIVMTSTLTSRSSHVCEYIKLILRPDLAAVSFEQNRLQ
jgi:GntR family transcriptional regulator